jgi:hypothetical protein
MYVCMNECMYKEWATKTSPCTATFEDLYVCINKGWATKPTLVQRPLKIYMYVFMYVCINKGWATKPALAQRPLKIYMYVFMYK